VIAGGGRRKGIGGATRLGCKADKRGKKAYRRRDIAGEFGSMKGSRRNVDLGLSGNRKSRKKAPREPTTS